MDTRIQDALRRLPAVDEVIRDLENESGADFPHWAIVHAARDYIAALRKQILAGEGELPEFDLAMVRLAVRRLLMPSLRQVLNATGVVLHTNLGRAPLSQGAIRRLTEIAGGFSNLEYDVAARQRGDRHVHAADILIQLSGAEDAVVVNNNAAAVLLCLAVLATGREVIVSRGELIEIGGSFRLPDIMSASGAMLREVGTTNRTHLHDFAGAINERTALLLKAHRSNFAVVGFTAEITPHQLVVLAHQHDLPAMFDLGSGSFLDLAAIGLPTEMTVPQAIKCGFDLVTFSGDKLLGGPQAGIIVGRREYVAQVRKHPLMRAMRPDKMTLAALEATLESYRLGQAASEIPALQMLASTEEELQKRAAQLCQELSQNKPAPWIFALRRVLSKVGGGAMPQAIPYSWAVTIDHENKSPEQIEVLLRQAEPPVVARIEQDRLLLDLRAIFPEQIALLARTVCEALRD